VTRWISWVLFAVTAAAPALARAEKQEIVVGVTGGALFPALHSTNATDFTLTTWVAGVEGQYGVSDNLSLRGSFLTTRFLAQKPASSGRSTMYTGSLAFDAAYYLPSIGIRYKVFAGYNLAPYVELSAGYLWGVFSQASIQGRAGRAPVPDWSEGHWTAEAGVAIDYRLMNTCLVGTAVRFTQVLGGAKGVASHFVSVPIVLTYYW
jgi:hypothetical protein